MYESTMVQWLLVRILQRFSFSWLHRLIAFKQCRNLCALEKICIIMCHYYYSFEGRQNDGEEKKQIWIEQKRNIFFIGLTSVIYLCKLIMCSNITTIVVINFVRWGTHFLNHWIVFFFFSFAPCPACSCFQSSVFSRSIRLI